MVYCSNRTYHKNLPSLLPAVVLCKTLLQLMQRFFSFLYEFYICLQLRVYCRWPPTFPRIFMIIADQLEERALLYLKDRCSAMNFNQLTLPSSLRTCDICQAVYATGTSSKSSEENSGKSSFTLSLLPQQLGTVVHGVVSI